MRNAGGQPADGGQFILLHHRMPRVYIRRNIPGKLNGTDDFTVFKKGVRRDWIIDIFIILVFMDMGFRCWLPGLKRFLKGTFMIFTGAWNRQPVRDLIAESPHCFFSLQTQFLKKGFVDIQNPVVGSDNHYVLLYQFIDEKIIHGPVPVVFL